MLKIAVPNKGALSDAAVTLLRESGYAVRRDSKELVVVDAEHDIEFFYLRPRDIAVYVGSGTLHGGITGRDLLLDSGSDAIETMALGFARSTFRFAARPGVADDTSGLAGLRIATSYDGLVRSYLDERGIEARVVRLDGAVETSITLGVADVIADVVETGTTLRNQGLAPFGEPILTSEAVLISRPGAAESEEFTVLSRRIDGVMTARTYVLVDYDIRAELVEEAVRLTPGIESPTVSPLHDTDFAAVRSMVPRAGVNRVMDALYALGARGILVTDIAACRL